ncbi:MAG: hypothetical protein E7661_01600 [Ruminococcaceae bacterium]|nr:hypothetical protein [Oscillospiraceae bacterium]
MMDSSINLTAMLVAAKNIGDHIESSMRTNCTLGLHTDGLLYVFYNGQPIGNGIALPSGGDVVGNVDSANNIVVTGTLPDGTYTVKYMMDDGSTVDIGTLQLSSGPAYTNLLEDAGYQADTRINSAGVESAYTGLCVSGFIPFTPSDTYMLLKNISVASPPSNLYLCFYDSNKNPVFGAGSTKTGVLINSVFSTTRSDGTIEISQTTLASGASHDGLTLPTDYAYVRFNATVIDDTSIVTVDEEIL